MATMVKTESEQEVNPDSSTSGPVSSLELLLKKQIMGAQCAAHCSSLKEEEEASQCREVCSHLIASSSSSTQISTSSSLCSLLPTCGEGCQQACKPPSQDDQPASASITSLTFSSSSISWSFSSTQPVVFLVAGKDPGGKWHLVSTTIKPSLTTNTTHGFMDLRLLAVTSSGVADRKDFNMEEMGEEDKEQAEEEKTREEREEVTVGVEEVKESKHYTFNFSLSLHSLSFLALPGCLALLLLFILLLLERRCNKRKRIQREEAMDRLESIVVSSNKEDTDRQNRKELSETVDIKDQKVNDISNSSLPTYVEAMQSFDSDVASKKEKSAKEKTEAEMEFINKVTESSNKVPEFTNNLFGGSVRLASPVFSIVTISCPTAVDNCYQDVENPYRLTTSNSFAKR